MTALAAANVTLTKHHVRKYFDEHPAAVAHEAFFKVAFGDATLTYPAGGIPMPDLETEFGFDSLAFVEVEEPADGKVYRYDRDNHKMLIYNQGVTTGDTTVAATEDGALAVDVDGAETDVRLSNTAAETSYSLGALQEVPAAHAPAATVVYMKMTGVAA